MRSVRMGALLALVFAASAFAQEATPVEELRPRNASLQLGLGGYLPRVDTAPGVTGAPYASTFGQDASMLLFQAEVDRFLWQKYGAAGVGFSFGYAEKYGPAQIVQTPATPAGTTTTEKTALKVLPLRLLAVYRMDYGALHWGIPLVPFVKVGLAYTPWWVLKGDDVETFQGQSGSGGKWGYSLAGGLALMLDFLEPDLARNLATDTGIEHTYFMAEFINDNTPGFGSRESGELDLSSKHWLFSLAMDF